MNKRYLGKCFAWSPRVVPDRLVTHVSFASDFNLDKQKVDPRDEDGNIFMRDRREAGWDGKCRTPESHSSRLTTTYADAGVADRMCSRRDNNYQVV